LEAVEIVQQPDPDYMHGWETTQRSIRQAGRQVLLPEDVRLPPEHFLYGRASTVILPDVPVFQMWFRPAYDTPGLAEPMARAMSKPRRKSLRRKPLEWKGILAASQNPVAPAAYTFTDTANLDQRQIRQRLEMVKQSGSSAPGEVMGCQPRSA
jgi:hypothetical protein